MTRRDVDAGCASDLALDEMLDGRGDEKTAEHAVRCAACGARLDELRRDRDAFLERARPEAFAADVLSRAKKKRWWPFALTVAPLVLGAAAVVLVWMRPHPPGERIDDTRVKGEVVASELYVQAGGKVEKFDPAHRYHAGDALQLVYTTTRARWLTVIDAEQGGKAEVVYQGERPLPPGKRARLDRSFVLDGAAPAERLYVLFTDGKPDAGALLAEAQKDPAKRESLPVPAAGQQSYLINR
jgi:hypothetical protein